MCTFGSLGTGKLSGNQLRPVPVLGKLQGKRAVCAAAGGAHTVVITARGDLYAFGRQGVNGVDGERDIFEPEQVVLPTESGGVTQASASWFYTLVSTRSGDVYEFGGQRYGGASQATPSRVVRSTCTRSYSPVAGDANLPAPLLHAQRGAPSVHLPAEVVQRLWWPTDRELAENSNPYTPASAVGYIALQDDGRDNSADGRGEPGGLGVHGGGCKDVGSTALNAAFWADD